jgi:hypothetical protein
MEKINIKGNMLVKKRERKENVAKTIEEAITKTVEDFFFIVVFYFFFTIQNSHFIERVV